jgi:hypothetical protein
VNLVGAVEVIGHGGSDYQVEVTVRGSDAREGLIRFEEREGQQPELRILFPLEQHREYRYPVLGRGQTRINAERGERGWLSELLTAITGGDVRVAGRGPGLEVWADVTVRVPEGGRVDIEHGVGAVLAKDLRADARIEVLSGAVAFERIVGDVVASTGSGEVTAHDVRGDLSIDTGSGSVRAELLAGGDLSIDTGSGGVDLVQIDAGDLLVDTGSGAVRADEVSADSVRIDTGSGSVRLALSRMGAGPFDIDTGSGSITLLVPADASADVDADTGSGGIDVDLAGVTTLRREHDEMRFRVGGGSSPVRLDAGSGRIVVARVDNGPAAARDTRDGNDP